MSIKLSNVSKNYQSGDVVTQALKNVTYEIKEGKFVVVLGPSGSGKSTLLNVMGGLDALSEGEIHIDTAPIHTLKQKELTMFRREKLGFIFQQYNLLQTLTVRENVEIGARLVDNPMYIDEILKQVGLTPHKDKYPFQLSGGEQQRVAIARALVKKPTILFCDEPTGALDEKTGKDILGLLQDLNKKLKTTIILITHNPSIANLADIIIKMNSGEIAEVIEQKEKSLAKDLHWS
ncbi:ABC transporter ATP-binding protein [Liberiplasma polymorphum]|uniref:ABC transporter ATP-binding protein n=1 Tax=Liberiplasma polymorphum TaxID=3374570 RepID=UPI003772CA51